MAENLNAAAAQPMPGNEQKMIQSAGTRFKWLAVFAFLVTWLTLLGMLLGVADAYGQTLTVFTAIEYILNVFNMQSSTIYESLAKAALAIIYAVMLIILLKNAVAPLPKFFATFSGKKNITERASAASVLCNGATSSLVKIFCLGILARVLANGEPTGLYNIGMIVAAAYSMYVTVLTALPQNVSEGGKQQNKRTAGNLVYAILRQIFFLAFAYFMSAFLVIPAGYNLSFDIQVLFGGYFNGVLGFCKVLATLVGQDILFIVAIILFMRALKELLSGYNHSDYMDRVGEALRRTSLRIFIIVAIGAALLCLFSSIGTNFEFHFENSMLTAWWDLLRPRYIPILLASLMGLVASSYTK